MKAKKATTIERYKRVRDRYKQLDAKNMYKDSYMFKVIAEEFFLSVATIENIVFNRV